jgi:hypothetical protein
MTVASHQCFVLLLVSLAAMTASAHNITAVLEGLSEYMLYNIYNTIIFKRRYMVSKRISLCKIYGEML